MVAFSSRISPTPPGKSGQPKFKQLAHNVLGADKARGNASPAVSEGQLFLRNDEYLYCIGAGKKGDVEKE